MMAGPPIKPITKERLLSGMKEVPSKLGTPCWVWQRINGARGYGQISQGYAKFVLVHRASYELFVGPIPEGLEVCHRCDNRPCINPDHLFVGTSSDNHKDMKDKKRHLYGSLNNQSKLTDEKVMQIRFMLSEDVPKTEIAKKFGVSAVLIALIDKGERWPHLKDKPIWSVPIITEVFGAEKQQILEELNTTKE